VSWCFDSLSIAGRLGIKAGLWNRPRAAGEKTAAKILLHGGSSSFNGSRWFSFVVKDAGLNQHENLKKPISHPPSRQVFLFLHCVPRFGLDTKCYEHKGVDVALQSWPFMVRGCRSCASNVAL